MDDEWIPRWPLLGFEYLAHGLGIQGVRPQPIYRFRGKSDRPPGAKNGRSSLQRIPRILGRQIVRIDAEAQSSHSAIVPRERQETFLLLCPARFRLAYTAAYERD
jgi:hypothetical protein